MNTTEQKIHYALALIALLVGFAISGCEVKFRDDRPSITELHQQAFDAGFRAGAVCTYETVYRWMNSNDNRSLSYTQALGMAMDYWNTNQNVMKVRKP